MTIPYKVIIFQFLCITPTQEIDDVGQFLFPLAGHFISTKDAMSWGYLYVIT